MTVYIDIIDADTVDGYDVGNAAGQIPINNGTLSSTLNADLLDGLSSEDFSVLATSFTLTRNISGFVTQKAISGGATFTYTRDLQNFITSKTDGTSTWTYTRNASNQITATTVT